MSFAQKPVQVSGKLLDKTTQTPLEFATVSVISSDPNVSPQGGITDLDGNYQFLVTPGTYTVKWEFISFKPVVRENVVIESEKVFETISMEPDIAQLEAAVVVAEKTTVDLRLDKKIYNIGQDLTVRGGSVSDVLDNVPSVSVDVEGNVSLRGNDNVRILIDGRPSALVGFNGAEALRQIPAEAIERVEVITSPSARYDAEGTAGILNIILRKNQIKGFNGSFNISAGYPERYGASANINYRTNKWNLFTNTGYNYRTAPGFARTDIDYKFDENEQLPDSTLLSVRERRDFDRLGRNYFTSFGAEYFINDNSSIVGNVVYRLGNDDDETTNNNTRTYELASLNEINLRRELESEDENDLQFSLDYQNDLDENGQKLTATAQYSLSVEDQEANIDQTELISGRINDLERLLETEDETEALLQVDWVKPVGENIQYEAGYRGNYRDIANSFFFEEVPRDELPNGTPQPDLEQNNTFNYEEFVNAVYGQYGQEFGEFSLLAGLRFEQTNINIDQATTNVTNQKDYSSFFPTLNLAYELQEDENITLGYNRRVRRPRGRRLNPFPSRSSQNSFYRGNIDLNPEFSNQIDLGYLRRWSKLTLSTSIYYNRTDDNVETLETRGVDPSTGDPAIFRFPVNLSTQERLGYELTLTYRPFKWWTINSDANVFRVETDGFYTDPTGVNDDQDFDFVNTTYFLRLNQKFTLPSEIDFQARINYRGASENAQGTQNAITTVNLAASKDILNEQGSLTLNVSDLLNSRRRESTTNTASFISDSEFQYRQRQVTLAFTYRFNQQKREQRREEEAAPDEEFEG
ncbi:TonB-dependent receptor [Nonlabens agnitus]|uniref:TonB-dependent receptor n=1 Tax=Nonlabens agnitus TaxID=870484 RepID=A0A2S9WXV8_9FLAO|nr:TonB-dependent receptor [Nonlabens agnitus]